MTIQDWFDKRKEAQIQRRALEAKVEIDMDPDLWTKCVNCDTQLLKKDIEDNMDICPVCDYHFRINARKRLDMLVDENSFEELFTEIKPADPINFTDTESYVSRIERAKEKTGLEEAVITGIGSLNGQRAALIIMDFDFMGGSMGSVVGEKVTRTIEKAIELRLPVIAVTSSGGARMQESALSLMQMAKTSCACSRLDDEKLLYINVLTEPTFGGVTASFGMLGDIIVAEQGARIGFAGRRVIEQTIRQKLPQDFQTAEYLMKYGQIDIISSRKDLKKTLSDLIEFHNNAPKVE